MIKNFTNTTSYEPPLQEWWQGRNDGSEAEQLRWWQHIQMWPSILELPNFLQAPVLLGFASDEGVARNNGRIGSAEGARYLRKALSNLPVHNTAISLYDVGTIHCIAGNLEEAQMQLAVATQAILKHNGFPILLGGGHEMAYGHYAGASKYHKEKKLGMVNFDAHFDLRKPGINGVNSGTSFYQIAKDCQNEKKNFLYQAIGIQESENTTALFQRAEELEAEHILATDFHLLNMEKIKARVLQFLATTDAICLTIDLDVFSASIAPGVSAPAATGILYDHTFREILKLLANSEKVISLDIAEYNPKYDIDSHTAMLAAQLIFDWTNWKNRSGKQ